MKGMTWEEAAIKDDVIEYDIAFNIIYIMRTSAQIRQKSACNHHHGIKRSSLLRSFVFDRQPPGSLLRT
ncbi:hypothetical protein, partial [Klebsiella pneumoniae]|uniref:hypothetical protein n=1 Tax=Klebsiella pneumoniae TaxID=573 RepID=UPI001BDDE0C6